MADSVEFFVNGKVCNAPKDTVLSDALRLNGFKVITLCAHPRLKPAGKCKVCVVEIEGEEMPFQLSCSLKVKPGMRVRTDSPGVKQRAHTALFESMKKQKLPLTGPLTLEQK